MVLAVIADPSAARAQETVRQQAASETPDEGSDFGGELRGYMGFGGEKLGEVEYSDGSSSDLSTGTYFFLGLGGIYSPWRWGVAGVDLELLAGWATWSTGPENTDDRLRLSRFPLEALAYYRHTLSNADDNQMLVRVGGGVSWHLIGGVSGSGSLDGLELDIDNALGGVMEAAFIYTAFGIGVRYTPMTYRVSESGEKLGASSLGAFLSLHLEPGLR
jgi:hypothetical protein